MNSHFNHDRIDSSDNIERIYPYPAIPRSVRPHLERCFQIDNISQVNSDSAQELARLERLSEINETLGLVRAYCGTELSGSAYKAAALGVIEDAQDGLGNRQNRNSRAKEELEKFFQTNDKMNGPYSRRNIYIAGLLQDRRRLDKFRERARSSRDSIDYMMGMPAPDKSEWLANPAITDSKTLYDAVQSINIESILISGAETLVRLNRSHPNNRETLDLVRYSEQILAPIAEVIGFDTLAMSLNSTTKTIRLENGGRGYLIHRAKAMLDRFKAYNRKDNISNNTKEVFKEIISDILDLDKDGLVINTPVNYSEENTSIYGDTPNTIINIGNEQINVAWRFRLKTVGSLAWKMYQDEKKGNDASITPMDVLGITAVVNDVDEQVKLFTTLVNGLYSSNNLQQYPAPTKTSPIHIRGIKEYIDQMSANLIINSNIDIKEVSSTESLHYGKVTGFYGQLPFEIQCVTRPYRDSMQIGPLAHIIYKANSVGKLSNQEVDRWTKLLSDIKGRRSHLGEPGLVGSFFDDNGEQASIGKNEEQAIDFIKDMLTAREVRNRTVGFVAVKLSNN